MSTGGNIHSDLGIPSVELIYALRFNLGFKCECTAAYVLLCLKDAWLVCFLLRAERSESSSCACSHRSDCLVKNVPLKVSGTLLCRGAEWEFQRWRQRRVFSHTVFLFTRVSGFPLRVCVDSVVFQLTCRRYSADCPPQGHLGGPTASLSASLHTVASLIPLILPPSLIFSPPPSHRHILPFLQRPGVSCLDPLCTSSTAFT